jgi:diguanylate cyclase (GGDEF)-like protein
MKVGRTVKRVSEHRDRLGTGSGKQRPITDVHRTTYAGADIMGIPDVELTPSVRAVVLELMGLTQALRQELTETQRRLEIAESAADRDSLLPIMNRRAFVRELSRLISQTERYGIPTTLIYFDLDGFKAVNDSFGHAAGDAVLLRFADVLKRNVRDSDVVGRLGGDEFGVLLSHASRDQGHRKADKLADLLLRLPTVWQGNDIVTRFSYGAFELKSGDTAELALARADAAMYENKRAAR